MKFGLGTCALFGRFLILLGFLNLAPAAAGDVFEERNLKEESRSVDHVSSGSGRPVPEARFLSWAQSFLPARVLLDAAIIYATSLSRPRVPDNKCYPDVGCFNSSEGMRLSIGGPQSPEDISATFYFFDNASSDSIVKLLNASRNDSIPEMTWTLENWTLTAMNGTLDTSKPLAVVTHGLTGNKRTPWMEPLVRAILQNIKYQTSLGELRVRTYYGEGQCDRPPPQRDVVASVPYSQAPLPQQSEMLPHTIVRCRTPSAVRGHRPARHSRTLHAVPEGLLRRCEGDLVRDRSSCARTEVHYSTTYIHQHSIRPPWLNVTVLVVDWENGAKGTWSDAAVNTPMVGVLISKFLQKVINGTNCTIQPGNITLVGFSMGGQVMGFVGRHFNKTTGTPIWRIAGLDPAGYLFANQSYCLSKDDAVYVDVIHTHGGSLANFQIGLYGPVGDVDFYPNGGRTQAGCQETPDVWDFMNTFTCSHYRAPQLFIESLNTTRNCSFVSYGCPNWKSYEDKSCFNTSNYNISNMGEMGYYSYRATGRGQQYLYTNDSSPYCLGNTTDPPGKGKPEQRSSDSSTPLKSSSA